MDETPSAGVRTPSGLVPSNLNSRKSEFFGEWYEGQSPLYSLAAQAAGPKAFEAGTRHHLAWTTMDKALFDSDKALFESDKAVFEDDQVGFEDDKPGFEMNKVPC